MILFSPIGTADPITALGDGPMLHIVRHYRPIVVVLFLSAEIAAFENADRRYSAAITRLAPETDVRIVTYTNPSVHRFDLFVPVFRNHLVELSAEFPDRTILLNTSSGTPAMQAALVAINVFGIPRTTAVQVSTPARALSKPGDRESPDAYDLELMWDANDDNQPGAPNRCFEATSAALGALLERANLKQLIVSYDYSAAVTIAADSRLPDQVSNLIRGAMHRSRLEHLVAPKFFKDTAFTYDPANKVAEYISALALLAKREQWAEFARSATPAITIVLRAAVAKHLPEDRYLDDMAASTAESWKESRRYGARSSTLRNRQTRSGTSTPRTGSHCSANSHPIELVLLKYSEGSRAGSATPQHTRSSQSVRIASRRMAAFSQNNC